jgi:hypothetical protein
MTGLGMVRMISHVGVRLMVRHGGGGHSTDGVQDKSRTARPGRIAKKSRTINAAPRCAIFCRDVHFQKSPARTKILAHRIGKALHDRALAHNRAHFAYSLAAAKRG